MAKDSLRHEIIHVLCDLQIFPVGFTGYSWEIAEIVKAHISEGSIQKVKNFKNCVREVLETLDGSSHGGVSCAAHRHIGKRQIKNSKNRWGYVVLYTLEGLENHEE